MTDGGRAGEHRSVQILLALLIVGTLVPIWVAPIPPQDLPNHLVKVDILRRWMRGDQDVREIYALNLKPLANYTCYAVLLLLAPFFNLITAARILLSLIVAGLPLLLWNPRPADEAALQPSFDLVRSTPHLRVFRSRAGVRRKIPATDPACAAADL